MAELLEGIRVLDATRHVAGPFATKILADYGADVLKVEPPEGDPARREGPFFHDEPHPERSALFLHLNTNKRSITLDLDDAEAREIFRRLAAESDIVIEDFPAGHLPRLGLGWEALSAGRPATVGSEDGPATVGSENNDATVGSENNGATVGSESKCDLVMASITPYGQSGPYRDYRGSEITLQAQGGPLHLNGTAEREPLKLGGYVAHYHAGTAAALAVMLARLRVEMGGDGDYIDLAVYECQAGFRDRRTIYLTAAAYTGMAAKRQRPGARMATGVRPCLDGYVNVLAGAPRHLDEFLHLIGRADLVDHPDIHRNAIDIPPDLVEEVEASYLAWLMQTPKQEVIARTQALGILGGAVFTTEDLTTDPHYRGRGAWETVDHPFTGPIEYPGRQLVLSETPKAPFRRAPFLGEHNEEVLCGRLGYEKSDLERLRAQGAI